MGGTHFVAGNRTQGVTLARRVRRADNFLTRLRGLTFRRRLDTDEGLLLVGRTGSRTEASIHMFFVFFPIGVLWLDRKDRVVDKVLARPFRPYYAPREAAIGVFECHPDVLSRVELGDLIEFVPSEDADEA